MCWQPLTLQNNSDPVELWQQWLVIPALSTWTVIFLSSSGDYFKFARDQFVP